ncbi:sensor histidine kinase [Micromonospora avicenniae]|uniref:sensor histidine kinase n=1 Tax=Micromonospora avicenniae TaxID=1198245 RepID=UPI00331B486E
MRGRHGLAALLRGFRRIEPTGEDVDGPTASDPELLLRVLCHEFRTPVSSLTSLTGALADERRELTAADRRAIIRLARDQAAHLQALLRDATAGTGALTPAAAPETLVPLGELLREAAALVPAHRRQVRATRRAGGCPVPARRVRQVLVNLVENALRHGPRDGRVGIYATLRRSGLSLLVTNEGRVAASLLEALRRPQPGAGMSGLGLWIVRRLVAADGGSVHVHRLRPSGVAIEVLLPKVAPAGG